MHPKYVCYTGDISAPSHHSVMFIDNIDQFAMLIMHDRVSTNTD